MSKIYVYVLSMHGGRLRRSQALVTCAVCIRTRVRMHVHVHVHVQCMYTGRLRLGCTPVAAAGAGRRRHPVAQVGLGDAHRGADLRAGFVPAVRPPALPRRVPGQQHASQYVRTVRT